MTTDSTGSSDPARTVALLWGNRRPPRRGPRQTLTSDQVIAAAVEIADADKDISALSMRRVAEALGVGTMSLYTYVGSRAELVEAMLDRVYGDAVPRLAEVTGDDWRRRLRTVAAVTWDMCLRHPWVLQIFTGRPPLGPNAIARYDLELRAVDGIGLDDVRMDATITLVHTYVEGLARRKLEAELAQRRTGLTDGEWWQAAAPALAEVFDPARFPLADRVGTAAGQQHQAAYDVDHEYAFGLECLIRGVEALIRGA